MAADDFAPLDVELGPCDPAVLARNPPLSGNSDNAEVAGIAGFHCKTGPGIKGESQQGDGVFGDSGRFGRNGVVGLSQADRHSGVFGENRGSGVGVAGFSAQGIGVLGQGGRLAGRFEGDVEVTGDIRLENADCAEDFDVWASDRVEPGAVMVIDDSGRLRQSWRAYDRRVAGVISGAGSYRPGIVLDQQGSRPDRKPIALLGKVFCKVDTQYGAIEIGDLLTTSPTPGHAMKAGDPSQAFGAVIGKALQPLREGQGLLPILIALQ
ncbi:MAG: hypothetical protein FIA97_11410 [Methylococcaceae bacterium]|nr:hypothetical protein [Methylococcaceae bacterium]